MSQILHHCQGGECYGGGVNPHRCEVDSVCRGATCKGCLSYPTNRDIYNEVIKQYDVYYSGKPGCRSAEQRVSYRHGIELESQLVETCNCEIRILMSVGCKCGAI